MIISVDILGVKVKMILNKACQDKQRQEKS